ncbi:MAG TPA: hypothetical protein VGM23_18025 [Armatimonadota bacterium]|jgi:hypothetical protein
MAFHISVYRASDLAFVQHPQHDVGSDAFDAWTDEVDTLTLYENPLGAGDTIHRYWSAPAETLGLPIIARLYNDGLVVLPPQFQQLDDELIRLEQYWETLDWSQEAQGGNPPFSSHLREHAGYVHEAIRIARSHGGVILVR